MSRTADKSRTGSRTRARRLAMQAVYQWLLNDVAVNDIEQQFLEDPESQSSNKEYLTELLRGAIEQQADLSSRLQPYLDRPLTEVDPVEHAILLVAAYELVHVVSMPYKAVINEAVELTKTYGAEQAHKFVNGVLDKLATEVRQGEKA